MQPSAFVKEKGRTELRNKEEYIEKGKKHKTGRRVRATIPDMQE